MKTPITGLKDLERRATSSSLRCGIGYMPKASSRTIWGVMGFRRRRRRSKAKCPAPGCSSYMGICKPRDTHRRLDIKVYAPQHYAYAMIYFTGNDYFNRR